MDALGEKRERPRGTWPTNHSSTLCMPSSRCLFRMRFWSSIWAEQEVALSSGVCCPFSAAVRKPARMRKRPAVDPP
eukprot:scaffold120426_cov40-Prasinocladus_malaysianus.AAC.1